MVRIGLLADTHGYLDSRLFEFFADCDDIWHAGDFGPGPIADQLSAWKPLHGVHGNIDDDEIRQRYPRDLHFVCGGLTVWMTHIGGYPGNYDRRVRRRLRESPPGLFVCGHSHILRIMRDRTHGGMLFINPGAAGRHGFHNVRTAVRFSIEDGQPSRLQVVELGPRVDPVPRPEP